MTISDTVRSAAHTLSDHSESPRLDAELLLGKVLGVQRPALRARGDEPVGAAAERAFADLIARRVRGVPIAYLTGVREFWSLPLIVTPAVLVPRPETETLIERALEMAPADAPCRVLDLGTGSGAIALAIALERPLWRMTAVELSQQALEIAVQNAKALDVGRIDWRLGSWFEAVPGERFDLILANPPYIASQDPALAKLSAEPAMALQAGPTGLEALTDIISHSPQHLNAGGWLVLEHGITQAREVAQLLKSHGFVSVRTHADYSDRPRVTLANIHTQH
jgi:release factor glutamine methyltransferase